ncbi:MAG: hypothetical protein ABW024_06520 [Microbacterium sp.]
MTLVTRHNPTTRSTLDWHQADDGVSVATSAGEYAGFVDATPHGYAAHGARGQDLGLHDSRDSARAVIAASATRPAPAPLRAPRITTVRSGFSARHTRSLTRPE